MPCHYCGHCMQGCEVGAIFTSVNTLIPAAQRTGRLTLRSGALVREIEVDGEGRAAAVHLVDRRTNKSDAVRASVVVVACGAIESPRLLLNSRSRRFPNGLANGNDLVGRYLHGHTILTMHGYCRRWSAEPASTTTGRPTTRPSRDSTTCAGSANTSVASWPSSSTPTRLTRITPVMCRDSAPRSSDVCGICSRP